MKIKEDKGTNILWLDFKRTILAQNWRHLREASKTAFGGLKREMSILEWLMKVKLETACWLLLISSDVIVEPYYMFIDDVRRK